MTAGPYPIPPRLAVDANGFVWRIFDDEVSGEVWSMATRNPDNEPIPEPITYYLPFKSEPCDRICREGDCPCDIPLSDADRLARARDLAERWLTIPEVGSHAVNTFNDGVKQAARELLDLLGD